MRINYTITTAMWDFNVTSRNIEKVEANVFVYETLADAYASANLMAEEIGVPIPLSFFDIKRKSPAGTFRSMAWQTGVITLLKII